MGKFAPGSAELAFLDALTNGAAEKTAVALTPATRTYLGLGLAKDQDLMNLEQAAGNLLDGGTGTPVAVASSPAQLPPPKPSVEEEAAAELSASPMPAVELGAAPAEDSAAISDEEDGASVDGAPLPAFPDRTTHGKIFNARRTNPLLILQVLNTKYQGEWVEWEPDTLWYAIRRDFGPVGEITRNKIMALRCAIQSDLPWLDWDIFEDCGLAWNSTIPIFGAFQPMSPS